MNFTCSIYLLFFLCFIGLFFTLHYTLFTCAWLDLIDNCLFIQANAAQWGDTANEQWSATVGKSRPNPQQNPANELFWNTPPVSHCNGSASCLLYLLLFVIVK